MRGDGDADASVYVYEFPCCGPGDEKLKSLLSSYDDVFDSSHL